MRVAKQGIAFRRREEGGTQIVLTAVGDIMMGNQTLQSAQQAMDLSRPDPEDRLASGFMRIFEEVGADLRRGDLLVGNLETPLAAGLIPRRSLVNGLLFCEEVAVQPGLLYDGRVYGPAAYPRLFGRLGLPNFNAHPALARALRELGFDLVSTANNHALDRGHNGIDRTIEALRQAGLDYVGTVHSSDRAAGGGAQRYPCVVKEVRGIHLAFFSVTSFLNSELVGIPDRGQQVCLLPRRHQEAEATCLVEAIGQQRADPGVDLICVCAHWGTDNTPWVWAAQRRWAHRMLEAGADVILGHHPHLLQPMERIVTADGRETLVIYSLGNFCSDMWGVSSQSTAIVYITIKKNDGGAAADRGAFVSDVCYLPVARRARFEGSGQGLVQPVPIGRRSAGTLARNRAHILKVLGEGNCCGEKEPGCPGCGEDRA